MPRPVIIIHFQPMELYPPVMNMIDFIHKQYQAKKVIVVTSSCNIDLEKFNLKGSNIVFKRVARLEKQQGSYTRYFNYFLFYVRCLLLLLKNKPSAVLYYETLSSFPAWIYKKFINKKLPVFIHYHEYTSPSEYKKGMKMNHFFHKREKWLYKTASWISHTNSDRLKLFLKDELLNNNVAANVLPNYPSKAWFVKKERNNSLPVKIVYIGALSLDTMHTASFVKWVLSQEGNVIWDIYSNNIDLPAQQFLKEVDTNIIRLHKGVNYCEIPLILKNYTVGVILYNGHIPNYIFNAPNKLFEYLACGLDVWFPIEMKGCFPYITNGTYPKVLPLDFNKLQHFGLEVALNTDNCTYKQSDFYYENIYPLLTRYLIKEH